LWQHSDQKSTARSPNPRNTVDTRGLNTGYHNNVLFHEQQYVNNEHDQKQT